jgi:hypothetical protein
LGRLLVAFLHFKNLAKYWLSLDLPPPTWSWGIGSEKRSKCRLCLRLLGSALLNLESVTRLVRVFR